jgi:hypothetical protein
LRRWLLKIYSKKEAHTMGILTGRNTHNKKLAGRLARMRMTALFLVSVGVLAFLITTHPPVVRLFAVSPEQGSGRGAGGIAANAHVPSLPASFCLPTDISCIINNVSSSIAAGIQSVFQPISDAILTNPADIIYQTPLLTNDNDAQNSAIINLNNFFIEVVDIAFASLLLIAGYNVIVGRHLLLPSSTVMEILPRAVLIEAAVHFNLWFAQLFVSFENALTLDVIHIAGLNMLTNLIAGLLKLNTVNLLTLILLIVLAIMTVMLLVQMITRIALVAISLALAPLGLGCFMLPQTIRWGRLWLVTLSTSVLVQFIQVTALGLGGVFITTIANTSLLRLDKNLAIAFLAIGTLGLVLKIPNMLQTWALHPMMDSAGSGGGSGTNSENTYPTPSLGGFSGSGGSADAGIGSGTTTVTEAGAGGMMEGTMIEDASGTLLLMF